MDCIKYRLHHDSTIDSPALVKIGMLHTFIDVKIKKFNGNNSPNSKGLISILAISSCLFLSRIFAKNKLLLISFASLVFCCSFLRRLFAVAHFRVNSLLTLDIKVCLCIKCKH